MATAAAARDEDMARAGQRLMRLQRSVQLTSTLLYKWMMKSGGDLKQYVSQGNSFREVVFVSVFFFIHRNYGLAR